MRHVNCVLEAPWWGLAVLATHVLAVLGVQVVLGVQGALLHGFDVLHTSWRGERVLQLLAGE